MKKNRRPFRETDLCKFIILLIELAAIAAFIWFAIYVYNVFDFSSAFADEYGTDVIRAYAICTKDDYVNVRSKPGKTGTEIGRLDPGDMVLLDGQEKNGYMHCVNLSFEEETGWVFAGYIVYDEPVYVDAEYTVVSNGMLTARKYVDGRRTGRLKPMTIVTVYYWSEEWCVTNKGYLRSEYLEYGGY